MDLDEFVRARQSRWQRLTTILDRIDADGLEGLTPSQANELFALYRLASSDLNLAQTRTGNPALLEYLEGLVGRAYANLAVPRSFRPFTAWWRIVRHQFPARLRAEWRLLALAAGMFAAGAAFGFLATLCLPRTAAAFLPPEHLTESPSERVAELEAMERAGRTRVGTAEGHAVFSAFLFTHNIRIAAFAFALGFTFGIGTVIVLFFNGAMLGSLSALYLQDGVMRFFIAWIGPHGAIELPCIFVAGLAGLMLARAQFRRDEGSLGMQLRSLRPAFVELLIGTASLLVIAGAVEGGFSQVNEPTIPYVLKIAVAGGLLALLLAYWFWMPVKPKAAEAEEL